MRLGSPEYNRNWQKDTRSELNFSKIDGTGT